jgi:hypothetical protein
MTGYFDGKVIIPDEPLELPPNRRVVFNVEAQPQAGVVDAPVNGTRSVLEWAADNAVDSPSLPTDLAHQHDHYLYGTPKKS